MAGNKKANKINIRTPRQNVWMSLTLVPLVAGAILIITWALDWELVGDLENQHFLGLLFILGGFAFSNLIQRKWIVFAGWALVTLADFLLLTAGGGSDAVATAALVMAGLGFLLLVVEFVRQFQKNRQ
jgi:hypothetical protein